MTDTLRLALTEALPCYQATYKCGRTPDGPHHGDCPAGRREAVRGLLVERTAAHRAQQEAVHADLTAILNELRLGDHARPYSSHDVVQREVLPAIRALRGKPDTDRSADIPTNIYKGAMTAGAVSTKFTPTSKADP